MAKEYIVGIDSGTSIVKAVLFDMDGNEVCVSSRTTPILEPHFSWSEYDIEVEWKFVEEVCQDVLKKSGADKSEIKAIGLTGKGVGTIFIGYDNRPSRNAIIWNDTRCAERNKKWAEEGRMSAIFKETGNWLMAGDVGALVPWVEEFEPEVLEKTKYFCTPENWICFCLSGKWGANASDMFSQVGADRQYSESAMELEGILKYRDKFLPMQNPWEVCGKVTKKAAEETGFAEGTPVVAGGWDVVASTGGVGAIKEGQANIILGTSGVIMLNAMAVSYTPEMGCQTIGHMPGFWQQFIAPLTGTPNTGWFNDNFTCADKIRAEKEGRSVFALYDEEIAKVNPGCDGVLYHPYLSAGGERAPFENIYARGSFFGLNLHSNRHVLHRAVYEGMAFANKHCLDAYSTPATEIRLSGGGTNSPVWCQIFADVCDATIRLPNGTEFGAKGSAANAAFVAGLFSTQEDAYNSFCKVNRVYEPNPTNVAIYKDIYEVYKMIPELLTPAYDARAAFLKKYGFNG